MTVHIFRSHTPRPSVQSEEERAWVSFYRRALHDPAIAAEVLAQLDLDPDIKRAHLALYLTCRESLRRYEARTARGQRIARRVRWLVDLLSIRAFAGMRCFLQRVVDAAVARLPGDAVEPVNAQVRRPSTDLAICAARSRPLREAAGPVRMTASDSAAEIDVPSAPVAPAVRVAQGG